jgi:tRNA-splicing ligase RtcB
MIAWQVEGGKGIQSWCESLEDGAKRQAENLSRLPFAFHHVALMPDCHQGYGMPIGGVLATQGAVIPNAVGVDIGCGMCAVSTNIPAQELPIETIKDILGMIRLTVPVGFSHQKEKQSTDLMPPIHGESLPMCEGQYEKALSQIGTLGGGNHFIELQKDSRGFLWLMIHSGSRNIGYRVAEVYNKTAISLNERYRSAVPTDWELAFLPLDSQEGQTYLNEMNYCVDFALANRSLMMQRVKDAVFSLGLQEVRFGDIINIAHNYAQMEHHYGKDVLVHRKGATLAREGTVGIIPGSQGSASYIVRGRGNRDSFQSCSHGAGRRMGRKQAQRELNLEDEQRRLESRGIIHSVRNVKDLDEAPSAYKDIESVMREQVDLVEIVERLTPLAVVKG